MNVIEFFKLSFFVALYLLPIILWTHPLQADAPLRPVDDHRTAQLQANF